MKIISFFLTIFIIFYSCNISKNKSDIYNFVIDQAIQKYYKSVKTDSLNIILGITIIGDDESYLNLSKNPKFKKYTLSQSELEIIAKDTKSSFINQGNSNLYVSNEFFYSDKDEYIMYYRFYIGEGGNEKRMIFKKNKDKFELIRIEDLITFIE